jgi:hypothetical protein
VSEGLHRLGAVIWTDYLVRLRRPSTAVAFLALVFVAYLWVPDPATGRALMVVEGRRALYNSPAMAVATAMLCSFFIGLFGFYLVSQAIRLDLQTRCGYVIASTPVRNGEYLLGKVCGNALFLGSLAAAYMLSSMVMQLVRGEAPLEPGTYAGHYLVLLLPAIAFVSVVALLFESVPRLAGRLGDVLYFFLWMTLTGLAVGLQEGAARPGAAGILDFMGLAFMVGQFKAATGTGSFAIGASEFDAAKGLFVFPGFRLAGGWLAWRLASLAVPVPLFLLAVVAFHRFDPARVRAVAAGGGRGWGERLNRLVAPLVRLPLAAARAALGRLPGLAGAAAVEAILTLQLHPLVALALAAVSLASLLVPAAGLRGGLLPALFALLAVLLCGASNRERREGTETMIAALPRLGPGYVAWKLAAAAFIALGAAALPAARLAATAPGAAPAALVGALFIAAGATALGLLTGTPKAFLVLFLTFLYVLLNDSGHTAGLDFAGLYGAAGPAVPLAYLSGAALLLAAAHLLHRHRSRDR